MKVRTRIAPSPTGMAHVGTAYTALFNYAFARKNKGTFVIRIEDTDRKRHVVGAEEAIFESLKKLGLSWDESVDKGGKFEPYRQSERLDIYKQKAQELLEADKAYEDEGAIRFRNTNKEMKWNDLIHGEISFKGEEITDFVIMKSDGYPTYNFAVAIDDHLMEITQVIRGEEHISNTPRQLAIYDAFGWERPEFAHHPTLRNKERKKLSKRNDPVDLKVFLNTYTPEALVNFLCLLGWSHPEEKEIFDLNEFVDKFSLERVRKAGPFFDLDKLRWINQKYLLSKLEDGTFVSYIGGVSKYAGEANFDEIAKATASGIVSRIGTREEYDAMVAPHFAEVEVDSSLLTDNYEKHLTKALEALNKIKDWSSKENINEELMKVVKENEFKTGDFFMDLRVSIWGMKATPPIDENLIVLKERVLEKIERVLSHVQKKDKQTK